MILWEEKKFNLDDPITKWFPQFRKMKVLKNDPDEYEDAKRLITVLDLLTHRSGFTYGDFLTLVSRPGEIFNYGRSTDLLGILISTLEGKPLGKVMEEKIFNPLSMTDTFFGVPVDKRNRCASNFGYDG